MHLYPQAIGGQNDCESFVMINGYQAERFVKTAIPRTYPYCKPHSPLLMYDIFGTYQQKCEVFADFTYNTTHQL